MEDEGEGMSFPLTAETARSTSLNDAKQTCRGIEEPKTEWVLCPSGFTLIELLMVVAIIGMTTAISLPYFVKSIQGNRLRSASRSVVTVGRYARNMAILNDARVSVIFQIGSGDMEVRKEMSKPRSALENSNLVSEAEVARSLETAENRREKGAVSPLSRKLDGVTIENVEMDHGKPVSSGICTVTYSRNGRCLPYSVILVDGNGKRMTVTVDALGTAAVANKGL